MAHHKRKVAIRRWLAAGFGVAGAAVMVVDSLEHISRGFIGLSLLLILGVAVAAAVVGYLVGLAVGPAVERLMSRHRASGRGGDSSRNA